MDRGCKTIFRIVDGAPGASGKIGIAGNREYRQEGGEPQSNCRNDECCCGWHPTCSGAYSFGSGFRSPKPLGARSSRCTRNGATATGSSGNTPYYLAG